MKNCGDKKGHNARELLAKRDKRCQIKIERNRNEEIMDVGNKREKDEIKFS